MNTQEIAAYIKDKCGTYNTDLHAGFDAGLAGKKVVRVGAKKIIRTSRTAPDHFYEPQNASRLVDWKHGQLLGDRYKNHIAPQKLTCFCGSKPDGTTVSISRKGHVSRGPVVSMMARNGVIGDVLVQYWIGSKMHKQHMCGI
jgi:hypothetical protein